MDTGRLQLMPLSRSLLSAHSRALTCRIEIIKRGGSARAADAKKDTADAAAAAADDA